MGDIIDPKSTTMAFFTFNAMQTDKYTLKSSNKTAVQMFSRDDTKYAKADSCAKK